MKDWIAENTNGVEVDTESARPNLLFHLTIGGRGDETSPGILLNAHLDSEGVKQNPAVRFKKPPPGSGRLVFPEGGKSVGLDNKTGIAVILSTLHALTLSPGHPDWRPPDCAGAIRLYVLFTVEEEIGQRGALWMPIEWLKNSGIRHAICVDRRTDQHPEGQRHVVTEYHKVPLLVPTDRAMLEYLNRASKELGFSEEIPCSQSCNCSDAIELRDRFNAEVILPVCSGETADELKEKYDATTEDVRKDPHCSMRESPRKDATTS